ncbi:MAG: hypothetical protein KME09_19520 [Pleurocapsa minor HA4230-MV1]|nr:hypothetical protein [Pleurocapsa minor HA4230-MV1]
MKKLQFVVILIVYKLQDRFQTSFLNTIEIYRYITVSQFNKIIVTTLDYAFVDVGAEKAAYIGLSDMSLWAKSSEEVLHLNLVREFIVSDIYHNIGVEPLVYLLKN